MNMVKKLVWAAGLTLLGGAAAFGEFARGYFNNWANDCPTMDTIYSTPSNLQKIDFCMLSLKEGSYTVPDYIDYMAGNAWHCPTTPSRTRRRKRWSD